MKSTCWLLILLAGLAFAVGTVLAFSGRNFLVGPVTYWRGAIGFLLFAIALRVMEEPADGPRLG